MDRDYILQALGAIKSRRKGERALQPHLFGGMGGGGGAPWPQAKHKSPKKGLRGL